MERFAAPQIRARGCVGGPRSAVAALEEYPLNAAVAAVVAAPRACSAAAQRPLRPASWPVAGEGERPWRNGGWIARRRSSERSRGGWRTGPRWSWGWSVSLGLWDCLAMKGPRGRPSSVSSSGSRRGRASSALRKETADRIALGRLIGQAHDREWKTDGAVATTSCTAIRRRANESCALRQREEGSGRQAGPWGDDAAEGARRVLCCRYLWGGVAGAGSASLRVCGEMRMRVRVLAQFERGGLRCLLGTARGLQGARQDITEIQGINNRLVGRDRGA